MRTFGHKRPIRDKDGNITGQKESPVRARTIDPLGGAFGSDKRKRLVVELGVGDVIRLKPEKTGRWVSLEARAVYRYAIMCEANKKILEKARAKKVQKAERRERTRLDRQEKKFRASLKNGDEQ